MITLEQVKKAYPNPCRFSHLAPAGAYCVGGGFLEYLHKMGIYNPEDEPDYEAISRMYFLSFPLVHVLSRSLRKVVPALSLLESGFLALQITEHNDNSDFGQAWDILGLALRQQEGCFDADEVINDDEDGEY